MGRIKEDELKLISEAIKPIGRRYPIEEIYLFGSRARGENKTDSDYDFLVVPKNGMSAFKFCGLLNELEKAFGKDVDIVSSRAMDKDFENNINRDMVLIYAE